MRTVAIHGSCVTRDVFTRPYAKDYAVSAYIGRHGIVSAVSPPWAVAASLSMTTQEPSPWSMRVVRCDVAKQLFDILAKGHADLLLIDLVDEQLPLGRVDQSYVTLTPDLQRYLDLVGYSGPYPSKVPWYRAFSPSFWESSLDQYCDRLLEHFDSSRIVINAAYRTHFYRASDGAVRLYPPRTLRNSILFNRMLSMKYHRLAKALKGCHVVSMPGRTLSATDHRWGHTPYHYAEEYYQHFFEELVKV